MRSVFCWIIRATLVFGCGVAASDTCYPPGGVAGIVVATVIVTCVAGGLTAATAWKYWWTPRRRKAQQEESVQQQHRPQKSSADFAFDNPYFRNQEGDDATGKYKSSLTKNSLRSSKQSENSTKGKKGRGGRNHFVFGGVKKQKALDDTCLAAVERTFVNLRGHDFTGLGFNICGNMRDGILVKDVLHRGPASESGLIKAGDKIVNVTVSFTNIVYEDALTILSYASPYDVQLEIERTPEDKTRTTPTAARKLGSCSFSSSGQKLFHPLYRSQSIDDLTQIDREGPHVGPRRSQSVGVAAHKLAAHFRGSETKPEDRAALALSTTGSLNEKMLATVMADGSPHKGAMQWEKRFEDTLESDDGQKTPPKPQSSKQKDSRQYLDFPPTRRTLETRMVLDESDINEPCPRKDPIEGTSKQRTTRLVRKGDEDNDSDVSKDSLEVTHKGYQKRKKTVSTSSLSEDVKHMDMSQTTTVQTPETRTQRVYGTRSSTNDESVGRHKTPESATYGKLRDVPAVVYRNMQKSPFGERQKLNSSDTNPPSYGLPANGIKDEKPYSDVEPTNKAHKFSKKPLNPAGGMFTQINPFQMPAKQKHPGFKPRVYREESPPVSNGDLPPRHTQGPTSVLIKHTRTDASSSHGGSYHSQN